MPDLAPGSKVTGLDTPPTVKNVQADFYQVTITTYGVTASGGTYADCAIAFIAPTSGRVKVDYGAAVVNDTVGAFTIISPVVREGDVIGSGAEVFSATDNEAVYNFGTSTISAGRCLLVEGLTPGDPYNVRLEHKVGSNTGTIGRRSVVVTPAT